jgi:hypothetical protein
MRTSAAAPAEPLPTGTGPTPGPDGIWGNADDENLADAQFAPADWSEVFAVAGANGKPTVGAPATSDGRHGGPGMLAGVNNGSADKAGTLLQVGNGYLEWNPWHYRSTPPRGWIGSHTWGVGMDSRKDTLLLDTGGV